MPGIDADLIRNALSAATSDALAALDVFPEIGSTNSYLLEQPKPGAGTMRVALAGRQTAGRGRADRLWHSAPSAGLWLSAAYSFESRPANLPALTLATGVAMAGILDRLGVDRIRLKWPNDLLVDDRKLGGILIEAATAADRTTVVAGVGINTALPAGARERIRGGLEPTDLATVLADVPSLEALAALVVDGLFATVRRYDAAGFGAFAAAWPGYDWLAGKDVIVEQDDGVCRGTARGIDDGGALLLDGKDGLQRIVSGSVRLVDRGEVAA